jgi:hypothetical protein
MKEKHEENEHLHLRRMKATNEIPVEHASANLEALYPNCQAEQRD